MPTAPHPSATARLPTGVRFTVTADALEMVRTFGGMLHCHEGPGGCSPCLDKQRVGLTDL